MRVKKIEVKDVLNQDMTVKYFNNDTVYSMNRLNARIKTANLILREIATTVAVTHNMQLMCLNKLYELKYTRTKMKI